MYTPTTHSRGVHLRAPTSSARRKYTKQPNDGVPDGRAPCPPRARPRLPCAPHHASLLSAVGLSATTRAAAALHCTALHAPVLPTARRRAARVRGRCKGY